MKMVLFEDRNRVAAADATRHPSSTARRAASHMLLQASAVTTVHPSGERRSTRAAAHGWVGLGRIAYASSSSQLMQWRAEPGPAPGSAPGPMHALPIQAVIPGPVVEGPVADLAERVRLLYRRFHGAAWKEVA